jgi:nucleoside-diphosphate-sugar epimerase
MNVLLIGGTGLISRGIVKHLRERGARVTVYNRGQRDALSEVEALVGDRNQYATFESTFATRRFDAVIDMICFSAEQAESAVRAFKGRCQQFIFCSTVCTYGVKIPPGVLIDEDFPQQPISSYGRNKVTCEKIFRSAHESGGFATTIIRPSHTYGEGHQLIDQLEFDSCAWDRIERGLPVLCADGGMALWQATHRDDCGKLFAYACANPKTYGKSYNATRDQVFTWRDYYREAAAALGCKAKLLSMPADWFLARDQERFGLLADITRFHGAYDSSRGKRDVPEFSCDISFVEGARRTLADCKRRKTLRGGNDALYDDMVAKVQALGISPIEA